MFPRHLAGVEEVSSIALKTNPPPFVHHIFLLGEAYKQFFLGGYHTTAAQQKSSLQAAPKWIFHFLWAAQMEVDQPEHYCCFSNWYFVGARGLYWRV